MPSPFPGMDPYLEAPALWRDVYSSVLVEVRVALNALLPPGFAARTEVYLAPPEEVPEIFVEVRSPMGKTITVIELLSLVNKMSGRGREEYRRKEHELLRSDIHLLEIDLLRAGEHTLHRGDGNRRFETWAFGVRDALPRVAAPLTDNLPDVALDVKAILDAVYEGGRYGAFLDYTQPPMPPLSGSDALWAKELLS